MAIALRDAAVDTDGRGQSGLVGDAALATSALAGDEDALGRLLAAHQQSAYNVAYRLLGREADAKDAVQEAFLQALRAVRGDSQPPREPDRFRAWLLRTVANAALGLLRRRPRAAFLSMEALEDDLQAPEGAEPVRALETREARAAVFRALLALPDTQRAALTLREYEGFSYEEIATSLGLSHGAVETLLFRARRAFRAVYEGSPSSFEPVGCPRIAPLLSTMIDGELAAATWRGLSDHLRECPCCRRELAQLRRTRRLQALIPTLAVPQGTQWMEHANKVLGGGVAAGPAAISWLSGLLVANPAGLVAVKTGAAAAAMAVGMIVARPMLGQELALATGSLPDELSAFTWWMSRPGETPLDDALHGPRIPGEADPVLGTETGSGLPSTGQLHDNPSRLEHGNDVPIALAVGGQASASANEQQPIAPITVVPADALDRANGQGAGNGSPRTDGTAGLDGVTELAGDSLGQDEQTPEVSDVVDSADLNDVLGEATAAAAPPLREASSTLPRTAQRVYRAASKPVVPAVNVISQTAQNLPESDSPIEDGPLSEPLPYTVTGGAAAAVSAESVAEGGGPTSVVAPLEAVVEPPTAAPTVNVSASTAVAPIPAEAPKPAPTTGPTVESTAAPKASSGESTASQVEKTTSQTTQRASKTTQDASKTTSSVRVKK